MFKSLIVFLTITTLCGGLSSINKNSNKDINQFARPGLVAYAASYSSDYKNEPKYLTEKTKTLDYLNLGSSLDYYRGDSVKVGIIDSGINYDHEDFMVNSVTRVKGDSRFYSYETGGWVYYKASQHGYSYIDDTHGHGTNVAATVASAINGIGGFGLAPNVELYVYKVTNSNNGYEFGAIQNALLDAKSLGINVINMSFQSYEHEVTYGNSTMPASSGCSTTLTYYLNQAYNAGITLVGAAGNYNTDEPSYPGSNNHVINVGSLSENGTEKAPFSNYGSTIDIVAPGYVHVADKGTNSSYKNTSGTSFSAPLVTAAIALYIQKNPNATPSEIESALYASCDPITSGSTYPNWAGHGTLNVARFLGVDVPTDITINNTEIVNDALELNVGDKFDLDWTVNGIGVFDDSVTFSTYSGQTNVVSVNNNGRISAVGEGEEYVLIESAVDSNIYAMVDVTVGPSLIPEQTLTITRNSFSSSGNYAWYNWTESTSDDVSVSGRAEIYATTKTCMQFNKGNGNNVAAIFNTTEIPGSITKIEANTYTGTNRAWNAYVTSTACSANGSTLTFGSNKTTIGSSIIVGSSLTSLGTSTDGYSYFCLQENVNNASSIEQIVITYIPADTSDKIVDSLEATYSGGDLYVGDSLDESKISVTAKYTDSDKYPDEVLSDSKYELSGFESDTAGKKTVTATYTGTLSTSTSPLTTSFNVNVKEDSVTNVTVTNSKTYHPGDTISKSDITVTLSWESGKASTTTTDFSFASDGYQFKYADAASGGANTPKQFSVIYQGQQYNFSVNVNRNAYSEPSTSKKTYNGSGFSNLANSYTTNQTITVNNTTFAVDGYYYSGASALSLSNGQKSAPGSIRNTTSYSTGITSVSITGASPNVQLSTNGSTWVDLSSATPTSVNYYYFKLFYKNTSQSNYVNITKIEVTVKGVDNPTNVANYVMFEDTNNQCVTKLDIAVNKLNNLSDIDKNTFWTSNNFVIKTARERLQAWAINQEKELSYENNKFVVSLDSNFNKDKLEINGLISIVIISASICGVFVTYILIRNKKEH